MKLEQCEAIFLTTVNDMGSTRITRYCVTYSTTLLDKAFEIIL